MGSHSTHGLAVLVFLLAFTFLSWGLFSDGNLLYIALFVVGAAVSSMLFLRAKAVDHTGK